MHIYKQEIGNLIKLTLSFAGSLVAETRLDIGHATQKSGNLSLRPKSLEASCVERCEILR